MDLFLQTSLVRSILKNQCMHDLMSRLARKTPTKWYEVGIELEIEPATLDAFEEQTRDHTRLYIKVFKQWKRDHKVPHTWTTIIGALEAVGERTVANGISEWLREHDYINCRL